MARWFARLIATLTLFALASWASACREAGEPARAGSDSGSEFVGSTGSAGLARTRVRWEPARSPAAEARRIDAPSPPAPQTADLPSLDSDARVALDPDSEAKASEIASDSSRREAGFSVDSTGRAAVDSDAYALYRD